LVYSEETYDWRLALDDQAPLSGRFLLDDVTFDRLLAHRKYVPHRVTTEWVDYLRPHLTFRQLKTLCFYLCPAKGGGEERPYRPLNLYTHEMN
ncbi:MAG: hypothetical protein AAF514_10375, partial [Verrucomicrobiota bacterium]